MQICCGRCYEFGHPGNKRTEGTFVLLQIHRIVFRLRHATKSALNKGKGEKAGSVTCTIFTSPRPVATTTSLPHSLSPSSALAGLRACPTATLIVLSPRRAPPPPPPAPELLLQLLCLLLLNPAFIRPSSRASKPASQPSMPVAALHSLPAAAAAGYEIHGMRRGSASAPAPWRRPPWR
jgi:hypothetical protein